MPWFDLTGDARLGRCATEGCGGQPTFRLEADGVGSNFCSGCRAAIEDGQNGRDNLLECFRCVDDQDWDFLVSKLGWGGRERFWRDRILAIRAALSHRRTTQ